MDWTASSRAIAGGDVSLYALLDEVQVAQAMPRTGVGKIDKKALRALVRPRAPQSESV